MGLNCKAETDSYLQLMEVALLGPGDVVVAISQSGSSIDSVLTLKQAKENGAATICITGNAQSSITDHADVTLLSVDREARIEAIASRLAQVSIADALYVIMALNAIDCCHTERETDLGRAAAQDALTGCFDARLRPTLPHHLAEQG